MEVVIRPVRPEDADAVYRLNRESFGYEYDREGTARRLVAVLGQPFYRVLVAERDGAVVGYVHAQDYDCTYADPMKNILAIAVDPSLQGHGIGRALLEAVEDWARRCGCAGVRLVSGENREGAHRFYEAMGYHCRKLQKNFVKRF